MDVAAVTKLLPKDSYVEGLQWNGSELELRWSNHRIETPYTFHLELSIEDLQARRLPEGARERAAVPTGGLARRLPEGARERAAVPTGGLAKIAGKAPGRKAQRVK